MRATVIRAAALVVVALAAGCAEPGPREMRLGDAVGEGTAPMVWPAPPEVPRYAFAGELTGEENFRAPAGEQIERAGKLLAWLVGLGLDEERAVVLQRPQGGATDAEGRIYVTDVSHQAVFVFDPVAGRMDVWGFAAPGERFRAPIDVALRPRGGILVTDAELGAVFALDAEGNPRGRFGDDVLVRPTGIATDPRTGLVYVADTRANDVKIFDAEGRLVDFVGRTGDGPGELNAPTYIALHEGRLYVTDTLNSRVQIFDRDGRQVGGFGRRGLFVGNLARPKGLTVDRDGNVYVTESYYDYLLVFDRDGRFLLPIGGTGKEPGEFYLPAGIWTDGHDRIFVADMFNGRVVVFQYLGQG